MITQRAPAHAPAGPASAVFLVVAAMAGYLLGLGWAMQNSSYDVWGAVALAPVLVALTVPLARRVARREADSRMARIVAAALILKLAGSVARYAVAFSVYGGVADATRYDEAGRALAPIFRSGVFTVDTGVRFVGTGFIEILTGLVYALVGPTKLGGFLVFSWLGFWGQYFFYRAFRLAFPGGDHRRYALLVFFLPSLVFWPSGIGKESWVVLSLGVTAYGAAKLFARRRGAFLSLGLGLAGTALARPHVALAVFSAVVFGYVIGRTHATSPLAVFAKGAGLTILLLSSLVMITQVKGFFGVTSLDSQSIEEVLQKQQKNTGQGGSEFETERANSITDFPQALVSILFRPFLFEAHNPQAAIAAAEGSLLLVLFFRSRRRIVSGVRRLRSSPYLALAGAYTMLFVLLFSSFANFGIIVRQRVQLLPFVLVLLALPATMQQRGPSARARRPRPRMSPLPAEVT